MSRAATAPAYAIFLGKSRLAKTMWKTKNVAIGLISPPVPQAQKRQACQIQEQLPAQAMISSRRRRARAIDALKHDSQYKIVTRMIPPTEAIHRGIG